MDCKKTFALEQQTPLIHFQVTDIAQQSGATLRASEVKPKLDRFILKRMGGASAVRHAHPKWFIDDLNDALNYKLRFRSTSENECVELGRGTPYDYFYGNESSDPNPPPKVKGVWPKPMNGRRSVEMVLICFDSELRDEIKRNLRDFFIVTNFGRMQDKGFGSFVYLPNGEELHDDDISAVLCQEYSARDCYSFAGGNPNQVFRRIKTIYSIIKSGYNLSDRNGNHWYRRSLLFLYMHNKFHLGNEKAELKNKNLLPQTGNGFNQNTHEEKYVRALLGVGELISSRIGNDKSKEKITIKSSEIERLASPVFFKVVRGTVYYVGGRLNPAIFNKSFTFASKRGNIDLKVPETGKPYNGNVIDVDFMDDFLEYCMTELNANQNHLPNDFSPLQDYPGMGNVKIRRV